MARNVDKNTSIRAGLGQKIDEIDVLFGTFLITGTVISIRFLISTVGAKLEDKN